MAILSFSPESALEFQICVAIATVCICAFIAFAYKASMRAPLDYDVYVVEAQSQEDRRIVQVVQIGYEESNIAGTNLRDHMASNRILSRIDDVSVVIQSPATIVESSTIDPPSQSDMTSLRAWLMELNGDLSGFRMGHGLAAAMAITVIQGRSSFTMSDGRRITLHRFSLPHEEQEENGEASPRPQQQQHPHEQVQEAAEESEPRPGMSRENVEERAEEGEEVAPTTDTVPSEPADEGPPVNVRFKFLDDTERVIETGLKVTLATLERRHFGDLTNNGEIGLRFIHGGHLLRNEEATLESVGVVEGGVVHVLMGKARSAGGERREGTPRGALLQPSTSAAARQPTPNNNGEQQPANELPFEERLQDGLTNMREVVNGSALLILAIVEQMASTWLGVGRILRDVMHARLQQAAARRSSGGGRGGSWLDALLFFVGNAMGAYAAEDSPLQRSALLSFIFPILLFVQIVIAWTFVAAFPRFFDYVSLLFLSMISLIFVVYCTRRPMEQR